MTDAPQTIPTNKIPAVEVGLRTDPGRDPDKQVNEDSAIHVETAHGVLAVVCDGMGGHAGGKEASELAIKTIVEIVEAAPPQTTAPAALRRAIEEANARVWSMPTAEVGYRPGSTVVAVLAHERGAEIAHVGDSRVYLVHSGAISQVTRDHSMVQEMVDRNLIRAEDAAKHPDANKILRALGIAKEVDVEVRHEPVAFVTGDIFVLCSDGLSDLVEPSEILEVAGSHPPAQAAGRLVDLANARGGHDNITALVLLMKSTAAVREAPTVMKTMPLTAHMAPPDQGSGPTGTVVSAPALPSSSKTEVAKAAKTLSGEPAPMPPAAIPVAPPPPPRDSVSGRPRTPIVAIGIALAVAAVGILGAVLYTSNRPTHRPVGVFEDPKREAGPDDDDNEAGTELTVTPAPTLTNPNPTSTTMLRRSDGGGFWDPCAALRRARERDAEATHLSRLEELCRSAGGQP